MAQLPTAALDCHPPRPTLFPVQLCMSEAQARATLDRCPALGDLDCKLAARRLRHISKEWGMSRGEAALLVLRRPAALLPPPAEVVTWALEMLPGLRHPDA